LKRNFAVVTVVAFLVTCAFITNALADNSEVNIPITAEQAFDAVVNQKDPATGEAASVALIDVRTTAEYFWVGACGKVESIVTTSEKEYVPYNGKVTLKLGKYLCFKVASRHRPRRVVLPIQMVEQINTMDISLHIPTHIWDEAGCTKYANPDFAEQINSLAGQYDVLILMCRSGKRSNTRGFATDQFAAIYEIDQPDGTNGVGGFQGSSFGDVYNGFRGFPGRDTRMQDTRSVSWSDAGLPVHIGWTPFTITVEE